MLWKILKIQSYTDISWAYPSLPWDMSFHAYISMILQVLSIIQKFPFSYLKLIKGFRSRQRIKLGSSGISVINITHDQQSQKSFFITAKRKNLDHVIMDLSGQVLSVLVNFWQWSNTACNPLSAPLTKSEVSQTAWEEHSSLGNLTTIMWHPSLASPESSECLSDSHQDVQLLLLFLHIQRPAWP